MYVKGKNKSDFSIQLIKCSFVVHREDGQTPNEETGALLTVCSSHERTDTGWSRVIVSIVAECSWSCWRMFRSLDTGLQEGFDRHGNRMSSALVQMWVNFHASVMKSWMNSWLSGGASLRVSLSSLSHPSAASFPGPPLSVHARLRQAIIHDAQSADASREAVLTWTGVGLARVPDGHLRKLLLHNSQVHLQEQKKENRCLFWL